MNGAESLVATLIAGGIEVCFTNPGTSEMHLVAAFDQQKHVRSVLGLFEGVVTGAADGYARMACKPACTLLHLGPGLANGMANLHNARRARVPMVNIVGQHALAHLRHDAPLHSDIEGIAKPWSDWARTSLSAAELGRDTADAIRAAQSEGGQVATLIVPADAAWNDGGTVVSGIAPIPIRVPTPAAVEHVGKLLRSGKKTALVLGGNALYGQGLAVAGTIAEATGATLIAPYPFARMERGARRPEVVRVPYPREQAITLLQEFGELILVGAQRPIAYFASPKAEATVIPAGCRVHTLASPNEDPCGALEALASWLSAREAKDGPRKQEQVQQPRGAITLEGLAAAVAATLPENAIVVDESMTSGRGMLAAAKNAPPHDWLANTGGSIGIALPMAVGAAIACPSRKVLCLSADGSGMYTLQALWTMARESLKITTVIFSNRIYSVLKREFAGLGLGNPGPVARDLFEIDRPALDWVALAKGMGVPGCRVTSLEEFIKALLNGYSAEGPTVIEVPL
jgi:acetolactate synthase I/II/III large subunit